MAVLKLLFETLLHNRQKFLYDLHLLDISPIKIILSLISQQLIHQCPA